MKESFRFAKAKTCSGRCRSEAGSWTLPRSGLSKGPLYWFERKAKNVDEDQSTLEEEVDLSRDYSHNLLDHVPMVADKEFARFPQVLWGSRLALVSLMQCILRCPDSITPGSIVTRPQKKTTCARRLPIVVQIMLHKQLSQEMTWIYGKTKQKRKSAVTHWLSLGVFSLCFSFSYYFVPITVVSPRLPKTQLESRNSDGEAADLVPEEKDPLNVREDCNYRQSKEMRFLGC
ncbi:Tyrosine 3-Monooxygenase [Manis pentadactyla]|nr:Tyrosine 3-Monooxygenase [Manis pentadactyla]